MKDLVIQLEGGLLIGALFALAVLVAVAVVAEVVGAWKIWRNKRKSAALAMLAVAAIIVGGVKPGGITVDDPYIVDAGSYVTNDFVYVSIAKRFDIVPDDTEIMIYYRELAQTNVEDWVQYEKPSAPGYYVLSDFPDMIWMSYATNYNWIVAARYVPPPVVHTNGVWLIKGFVIPAGGNPPSPATYAFPNTKTIRKEDQ